MRILVLNAGSSSLKFSLFDLVSDTTPPIIKGEYAHFQNTQCSFSYQHHKDPSLQKKSEPLTDITQALSHLVVFLEREHHITHVDAVGYRVAHGGEYFHQPTRITDEVIEKIASCTPLAPLHNPANLKTIEQGRTHWPTAAHVAVFDTAFHHTLPEHAYTYAVPKAWRDSGLRRYGFHGTSHKYIALKAAEALNRPLSELKIISCHLGNGASVCAIHHGTSIDTSMGMTPLEGLIMGTRCGDIDPGTFGYLQRTFGLSIAEIEHQLYHHSGLHALAHHSDLRDVENRAAEGDHAAQLAIHLYAYRTRKYIGAYIAAMGGLDALVFTGGIGEHSPSMRRRICDHLSFCNLYLDDLKNQHLRLETPNALPIHSIDSLIPVFVTKAAEQWMIAKEVYAHLNATAPKQHHPIPVAVSARHVHLSQHDVERLFGPHYQLTKQHDLAQPGTWAAEETVEVIGPKGSLEHVRILGPTRSRTQIEVSKTDTFTLGLEAPVRPSGHLENTPSVTLKGPITSLKTDGLIIASRHIHISPEDAAQLGVEEGDYVDVRLGDGVRDVLFTNTLIRIGEHYITEMHIDTDEANAAGIVMHTEGQLINNAHQVHSHIEHHTCMK